MPLGIILWNSITTRWITQCAEPNSACFCCAASLGKRMPDCSGKPTARPSRRPKVASGIPTATTLSPGIATPVGTDFIALAKRAVPRRPPAVAKAPSTLAIAARMDVLTTAGGIICMLINVVAARCHITDRCGPRADTLANAACMAACASTVYVRPIHIMVAPVTPECALMARAKAACAQADCVQME
jgi:hypothetical protein